MSSRACHESGEHHYRHNGLRSDLPLVTSDSKIVRVHSSLLRVYSHFFCDLLNLPPTPCCTADGSVDYGDLHLDETAEELHSLLANMYDPHTPVDLGTVQTALRIADKYMCPRIVLDLRRRLRDVVHVDPWLIFGIASQQEDRDLAATAITYFGGSDGLDGPSPRPAVSAVHPPPWHLNWKAHEHITYVYFSTYLRAWLSALEPHESTPGTRTWAEVAFYFKLYLQEVSPRRAVTEL